LYTAYIWHAVAATTPRRATLPGGSAHCAFASSVSGAALPACSLQRLINNASARTCLYMRERLRAHNSCRDVATDTYRVALFALPASRYKLLRAAMPPAVATLTAAGICDGRIVTPACLLRTLFPAISCLLFCRRAYILAHCRSSLAHYNSRRICRVIYSNCAYRLPASIPSPRKVVASSCRCSPSSRASSAAPCARQQLWLRAALNRSTS